MLLNHPETVSPPSPTPSLVEKWSSTEPVPGDRKTEERSSQWVFLLSCLRYK